MAELVERWAEIAQGRVPPLSVVKPLDVVVHLDSEFFDGREARVRKRSQNEQRPREGTCHPFRAATAYRIELKLRRARRTIKRLPGSAQNLLEGGAGCQHLGHEPNKEKADMEPSKQKDRFNDA